MIELEFVGAAQTVTGSMHLVRTSRATVLLDCGLFQGRRMEALERNRNLPLDPDELDAVVLSHAHIDHSGALPLLVKRGYRGSVYATPATRDLCAAMLADAAKIQAGDARFLADIARRGHQEVIPVEPLYSQDDVNVTLAAMVPVAYHAQREVAPGVKLTFMDAGHVLGSAICVLDIEDEGQHRRLAFSGDLGRKHAAILRDFEIPTGVQVLICESTYGDRLHPRLADMELALAEVIERTVARGGTVIVPSFALERAQEVIFALKRLFAAGKLPALPVIVDSPLTVRVTEVFRRHPDCYDDQVRQVLEDHDSPFDFAGLRYVSTSTESMAVAADPRPKVVIAGSGMCEAGRVLHHLRAHVSDPRSSVVIVGFQAPHTLGRRLVERRPTVRIFGLEHERRIEVSVLNGFSAHADQHDLIAFVTGAQRQGALEHVALVHGELPGQRVLQKRLTELGVPDVSIPEAGSRLAV